MYTVLVPTRRVLWLFTTKTLVGACCKGPFLVDAQALNGERFGILLKQGRGNGFNGFAVQAGTGEVGKLDFVAAYLQGICTACGKFCLDLCLDKFLLCLRCFNQLCSFFVLVDQFQHAVNAHSVYDLSFLFVGNVCSLDCDYSIIYPRI